jgi:hypothetical protein
MIGDGDGEVVVIKLGVDGPGKGGKEMGRDNSDIRGGAGAIRVREGAPLEFLLRLRCSIWWRTCGCRLHEVDKAIDRCHDQGC